MTTVLSRHHRRWLDLHRDRLRLLLRAVEELRQDLGAILLGHHERQLHHARRDTTGRPAAAPPPPGTSRPGGPPPSGSAPHRGTGGAPGAGSRRRSRTRAFDTTRSGRTPTGRPGSRRARRARGGGDRRGGGRIRRRRSLAYRSWRHCPTGNSGLARRTRMPRHASSGAEISNPARGFVRLASSRCGGRAGIPAATRSRAAIRSKTCQGTDSERPIFPMVRSADAGRPMQPLGPAASRRPRLPTGAGWGRFAAPPPTAPRNPCPRFRAGMRCSCTRSSRAPRSGTTRPPASSWEHVTRRRRSGSSPSPRSSQGPGTCGW